jgi:hypothetical protein
MNASKENAKKANAYAYDLQANPLTLRDRMNRLEFIRRFLDAAERKLPTEAAFKRDQQRRKKAAV